MLIGKLAKNGGLELTDKKTVVLLQGASATLDGQTIDSPGEYEHRGIEIVYGDQALLLVWERLQLVYIFRLNAPTAFEKSQFSSCDILIVNPDEGEVTKGALSALTDAYDPSVIVFGPVGLEAAAKDALKVQPTDQVKLAAQTLPTEGRDSFQLGS